MDETDNSVPCVEPTGSTADNLPGEVTISDELRAKLEASIAENKRLGPSVPDPTAPREYFAFKDQPVIGVRSHDTVGRRTTNFIELNVSCGLDGVALAKQIAGLLNQQAPSPPQEGQP